MEPLKQLNQAMEYIERNLSSEIDFGHAARLAGSSEYHFRRMFSFLSGMPLGEYIRRRRLALAALDLTEGDARILDLALKYGYDSPDAFTRAFQALHGVTPTEARRNGIPLKAVPPMTFQLTIRGGEEMDYKIIEKDAFSIVGLRKRVALQYNGVNPEIAAMWASLTPEDIVELKGLSNIEPRGFLSASLNFSEGRGEGTELDQVIGVATGGPYEGNWKVLPVEASRPGRYSPCVGSSRTPCSPYGEGSIPSGSPCPATSREKVLRSSGTRAGIWRTRSSTVRSGSLW